MANICSNKFFFTCEHNGPQYMKMFDKLKEVFNDLEFEVLDFDDDFCTIEGTFSSKWEFPKSNFEDLNFDINPEDECYFRCLSEEYGCNYVAMNIYSECDWWLEQTFEL